MPRVDLESGAPRTLSLRPAGSQSVTPATWALRVGCGALMVGVAMAGWSMLRPLPEPRVDAESAMAPVRSDVGTARSLEARESLLARLNQEGNVFAPDRADWTVQTAQRRGTVPEGDPNSDGAEGGADRAKARVVAEAPSIKTVNPAAPVGFDSIPVVEKPPAGVAKDLSDLRLRGVYSTGEGPVALIGSIRQKNSKRAEPRRVGDVFGDEEWSVVAIDEVGKRVILGRGDVNVMLAMWSYESGLASAKPAVAAAPEVLKPSVVVYSRTPEQVRADLAAAGISQAEIDELLSLSETTPANAVAEAPARDVTPAMPEAPAAMVDLLKMMSSDAGMPRTKPAHQRERTRLNVRPEEPPK